MRALAALCALALLGLPASASTTVTIHLKVDASVTFPFNEPAFTTTCDVTVNAGDDAGDVLDAAVASGCLAAWSSTTHALFGRLLTGVTKAGLSDSTDARNADSVRFACGAPTNPGGPKLTSTWGFAVDGAPAQTGIDGYSASDGATVSFHYIVDTCAFASFLAFAVTGVAPTSPTPVQGTATTDLASTL